MKRKAITGKLMAQVGAGVLAIAMLMGSTYAWHDFTQHKTNGLAGNTKHYDVTLNENFEPNDNWTTDGNYGYGKGEIQKSVTVTNPTSNMAPTNQGDVYVRVSLKEYMQIKPVAYTYSAYRFVTYPATADEGIEYHGGTILYYDPSSYPTGLKYGYSVGHFVIFDNLADAKAAFPDSTIVETTDATTGEFGFFVVASNKDYENGTDPILTGALANYSDNGIYGKYAITSLGANNAAVVVAGNAPFAPLATDPATGAQGRTGVATDGTNTDTTGANEMSWPTYYPALSGTNVDGKAYPGNEQPDNINKDASLNDTINNIVNASDPVQQIVTAAGIRDFVQLNFGNVVSATVYMANPAAYPNGVWVYDNTNPNDPYFYWSLPLKPGQTTDQLLKSVTLINQPNGDFFYGIHVDMEAVSADQYAEWGVTNALDTGANGSLVFTIPPKAPAAPVIVPSSAVVNNTTFTVDAVAGNDVAVSVNNTPAASVHDNGDGTFTVTVNTPLAENDVIVVTQTDPNTGLTSPASTYNVAAGTVQEIVNSFSKLAKTNWGTIKDFPTQIAAINNILGKPAYSSLGLPLVGNGSIIQAYGASTYNAKIKQMSAADQIALAAAVDALVVACGL